MGKVISVVNHKGGVGKTTTTLNLGKALSMQDQKVLIIDLDPQANLSQSVGLEDLNTSIYDSLINFQPLPINKITNNFFIVPADLDLSKAEKELINDVNGYFKLKKLIATIKNNFDYILVDCPPSLGILTINALIGSDEIYITLQAENLAVKGIKAIQDLYESVKENLNPSLEIGGVLITQFDRTVLKRTVSELVKEIFGDKVFKTYIRNTISLSEASLAAKDIFSYNSKSSGAEDYYSLSNEILTQK